MTDELRHVLEELVELVNQTEADLEVADLRAEVGENKIIEMEEELQTSDHIGLKIKARGRQRFRLQSTRRQVRQKLKYKIIK